MYLNNKGRGPTRLISPFKTLINWGSSSREVERINLPTGVMRWASGRSMPLASFLSFMDLNLMMKISFSR